MAGHFFSIVEGLRYFWVLAAGIHFVYLAAPALLLLLLVLQIALMPLRNGAVARVLRYGMVTVSVVITACMAVLALINPSGKILFLLLGGAYFLVRSMYELRRATHPS